MLFNQPPPLTITGDIELLDSDIMFNKLLKGCIEIRA